MLLSICTAQIFLLTFIAIIICLCCYGLLRVYKLTPANVRRLSLFILVLGLISIEFLPRSRGALPGINTPMGKITVMKTSELLEYKIMECDSNGINKFNRTSSLSTIQPLNNEGFHSIYDFSQSAIDSENARGKQVIFLIGDSWTYGLNADSGYSFASHLNRSKEYSIFNAGIPAADLVQYQAVTKKYILSGILKPQLVVVCISRNDLYNIPERRLSPGIITDFCTSAGGFHSFCPDIDTVVGGAQATYSFILEHYTLIPYIGNGWHTYIISRSVVLSGLLNWFSNSTIVRYLISNEADLKKSVPKVRGDKSDHTQERIEQIKSYCDGVKIPIIFILLPSKYAFGELTPPQFKNVLALNNNVVPIEDYPTGTDDHPNNDGHYKLYVAIKKILDNNEQAK